MEQTLFTEHIQHQYDALMKKSLKGTARNYFNEIEKRAARATLFSDLSISELNQLFSIDEYSGEYHRFCVSGFDIFVKNDFLAEALKVLSEKKRTILLLSFFMDMSDEEISSLLNVDRSTIFRNKKNALEEIRSFMEGYENGKGF